MYPYLQSDAVLDLTNVLGELARQMIEASDVEQPSPDASPPDALVPARLKRQTQRKIRPKRYEEFETQYRPTKKKELISLVQLSFNFQLQLLVFSIPVLY